MSKRNFRLAGEIKRDLVEIFMTESKNPIINGMVSITDLELSPDGSVAKVYVSKLGNAQERNELLEALEQSKGFLRTALSKRLQVRNVPELRFYLDESLEYGAKIEKIIKDLGDA